MKFKQYINEAELKTSYDVYVDNPDDKNDPFYKQVNSLEDIRKFVKEIVKRVGKTGMNVKIYDTTNKYKKVNLDKPDKVLKAK